jgi:RimJ/RimL family protein N-acetyltransferase
MPDRAGRGITTYDRTGRPPGSPLMSSSLRLRPVIASDLPVLLAHQQDDVARQQAAFTSADPPDAAAHAARWSKLLADPSIIARTIEVDGAVAGHIVQFERDGVAEVTYWLGRAFWGRGHATRALAAFLEEVRTRPLHARVAIDNVASRRVLEKCGFEACGRDRGYAEARGEEVEEIVLKLA